jgi:hypothetical protein
MSNTPRSTLRRVTGLVGGLCDGVIWLSWVPQRLKTLERRLEVLERETYEGMTSILESPYNISMAPLVS